MFKLSSIAIKSAGPVQSLGRLSGYPRKRTERDANFKPERWSRVTELFEVGAVGKLPPNHTLWGAYNAVTFYEDYRPAKEADSDRRLNRVWFGTGADLKLHALQQAEVLYRNQWAN